MLFLRRKRRKAGDFRRLFRYTQPGRQSVVVRDRWFGLTNESVECSLISCSLQWPYPRKKSRAREDRRYFRPELPAITVKVEWDVEIVGLYEYNGFMAILFVALWYKRDSRDSLVWSHLPSFVLWEKQHREQQRTKNSLETAMNCAYTTNRTRRQPHFQVTLYRHRRTKVNFPYKVDKFSATGKVAFVLSDRELGPLVLVCALRHVRALFSNA